MLRLVLAVEDPGEDIVSVGNLAAVGAFPGYDVPGITVDQFAGYSGASQIQGDAVMAVSGIARLRIYAVKTLPIPGQGQGDLPAGPGACLLYTSSSGGDAPGAAGGSGADCP